MADIKKVISWLADTELYYQQERSESHDSDHQCRMAHDALSVIEEQQAEIERLREIATRDCDICANKMLNDERRWIPVSERLPEERINPLTKDFDTVICLCNFVDATDVRMYQFANGHFYHWGMEMKCVTHWMYKPQPPEEGDGE